MLHAGACFKFRQIDNAYKIFQNLVLEVVLFRQDDCRFIKLYMTNFSFQNGNEKLIHNLHWILFEEKSQQNLFRYAR